jgi:hypothetical protein
MPEARACLRKKGHRGHHIVDLTGLENAFGYVKILHRGPDYVGPSDGPSCTRWTVLDKFGCKTNVLASSLFSGNSTGSRAVRGTGAGVTNGHGKLNPEYHTLVGHHQRIFNKNHPRHSGYRNMTVFDDWNPDKGGSYRTGARWIREHLGPKPGPDWQLHVLKTKKYPHGYIGPNDKDGRHIVWRHKMDRHDQDLLDLIHEWPKKKLREFVQKEIQPLLKRAA